MAGRFVDLLVGKYYQLQKIQGLWVVEPLEVGTVGPHLVTQDYPYCKFFFVMIENIKY